MVGAVLVYDDKIIGEGWHEKCGEAHAEVNCINSVAPENLPYITEATMYVSLEPCAHYGKTPPCAQLLINYKVKKVVVGCTDTFSKVSGRGIQMLIDAGIDVNVGVLEQECRALNRLFFTYHEKKRPYIALKWACSRDGLIAGENNQQVQISNKFAKLLLHKWRSEFTAFLVGYNTVVADNPKLSNRLWPADKQPIRLILDPENTLPCEKNIFDGELKTYIFNKYFVLNSDMTHWVKIDADDFIDGVITYLYELGITNIVVEGGSKTLQQFISRNFYDEIITIATPVLLLKGVTAPKFVPSHHSYTYYLIDNQVTHYYY
jgi:diaminohydroxyphosphoribosylaminopyrimidine deaminase/5-amino-6-(5-phosphoribosylamino)uracil reductase